MVSDNKIKHAFRFIKKDIMTIKAEVARLTKENEMLIKIVNKQTDVLVKKSNETIENKKSSTKNLFVASKNGGKFHKPNCPYARNIKPKDQIKFTNKNSALNKGYKACKCI